MAYGMTQVGYLGSQAVKYFYLALKFVLGKMFRTSNVTTPLRMASKVVLGTDFRSPEERLKTIDQGNLKMLESAWTLGQASVEVTQGEIKSSSML